MIIGIPKEIKTYEFRAGLTPASVAELTKDGHKIITETQLGQAIDFSDQDYKNAGAHVVPSARDVYEQADMIVKVKEPQPEERKLIQKKHTLFTFLHLAPDIDQTTDLVNSGATCIAYETVTDDYGQLPLLTPMSAIAGRVAVQAGAYCLEKSHNGLGILLGGIPGVEQAHVVIVGGGIVGSNALKIAVGMGARVTIVDKNVHLLNKLDQYYGNKIQTLYSTKSALKEQVTSANLVIGSVLIAGAKAPKIITRELINAMKSNTVFIDVAIDQGGCGETSKPTTLANPTYRVNDVIHYCVANIPGTVAKTATQALNNATLPFIKELSNSGVKQALEKNKHLRNGLNVCGGHITCQSVAKAHNLPYVPAEACIRDL